MGAVAYASSWATPTMGLEFEPPRRSKGLEMERRSNRPVPCSIRPLGAHL